MNIIDRWCQMKKTIFGGLLVIIGLVFSVFCFVYAVINPWNYNGITGLLGSFLGTQTLIPFVISLIVLLTGLFICGYEAYIRK